MMGRYERLQEALRSARQLEPDAPREAAWERVQPKDWQSRRLVIVAADHPARRVLAAADNAWAMADRIDFLCRVAEVLAQPAVDGVLATPDVFEELLVLNRVAMREGAGDILTGKVVVGSMNRGGLADTVFELDDFFSGYTVRSLMGMRLDAGKILLRVDPASRDSALTLRATVRKLNALVEHRLPVFLEPLSIPLETDELVRLVGVAAALGESSARRWLKLPMVDDFDRVARASTLPILLLGGKNPGPPPVLAAKISRLMETSPSVQGVMMGRGVLYPEDGRSPAEAALTIARAVKPERTEEVVPWLAQ